MQSSKEQPDVSADSTAGDVAGWQYFYLDYNQEIPHPSKATGDMENAVNQLPLLFPERGFSYHSEKLKELGAVKKC